MKWAENIDGEEYVQKQIIPNLDKLYYTDTNYLKTLVTYIKKGKVLDLGCGVAPWYPMWKGVGFEYEGLDFEPKLIELARERFPEVEFYLMPAEEMDFEEKYDLIFTHTFFQHIEYENQKIILERAYKAIKEGGYLLIEETHMEEGQTSTALHTKEGWVAWVEQFGFKCLYYENHRKNAYLFLKPKL